MINITYGFCAVLAAGVAITDSFITKEIPIIQYGALGLCGFMVYFLCKHISQIHEDHKSERKTLVDNIISISTKAVESYSALTSELQQKPCLLQKHELEERLIEMTRLLKNKLKDQN